jgi:hypothetical protein
VKKLFGQDSIFDVLEEEMESEGAELMDKFFFKFYQVLDEPGERDLEGPESLYSSIQDDLTGRLDEDKGGISVLKQVEDQYFGTGNFVGYDLAECFDEAVRETYDELDISHTSQ